MAEQKFHEQAARLLEGLPKGSAALTQQSVKQFVNWQAGDDGSNIMCAGLNFWELLHPDQRLGPPPRTAGLDKAAVEQHCQKIGRFARLSVHADGVVHLIPAASQACARRGCDVFLILDDATRTLVQMATNKDEAELAGGFSQVVLIYLNVRVRINFIEDENRLLVARSDFGQSLVHHIDVVFKFRMRNVHHMQQNICFANLIQR